MDLGTYRLQGLYWLSAGALLLPLFAAGPAAAQSRARGPVVHQVFVQPDGSFLPALTYVEDGDTVEWVFHARTDSIIQVTLDAAGLPKPRPYNPDDPNELTGPMPANPGGIFALGPVSNDTDQLLEVAQATWESDNVVGVFLRPKWSDVHLGPGQFDWTELDRELDRAVKHGKLYSLCFKAGKHGTPDWIFSTNEDGTPRRHGGGGVTRLFFQDGGSHMDPGKCGSTMFLGDPTDATYQQHYFELLEAAAEHLKSRSDWYRSLAYIKPSGANLFSHENRLPKNANFGCFENPQAWAAAGYTPGGLYLFYARQLKLLRRAFPAKGLSYMLIQAGFPRVNESGDYLMPDGRSSGGPLPGGVEQTEHILMEGSARHDLYFVVQHNGLGPSHDPNRWVRQAGQAGQLTGFQTNNRSKVDTGAQLEATFENAWDNTDAVFVEIYEGLLLEIEATQQGVLDPNAAAPMTIGEWSERFEVRRRQAFPQLGDPAPMTHRHTFTRTLKSQGPEILYYTHGTKRTFGGTPNYAKIVIKP